MGVFFLPQRRRVQSAVTPTGVVYPVSMRTRRRYKLPPSIRAAGRRLLTIFAVLLLLVSSGIYAYKSQFWLIKKVTFNDPYKYLQNEQKLLDEQLRGQSMFLVDTSKLIRDLRANPLVESVYVVKKIPHEIYINIVETQPYLYFISVSRLTLLSNQSKTLQTVGSEGGYSVNENERLIYLESRPFKSERLQSQWILSNEEQLRKSYTVEKIATTYEEYTTAQYAKVNVTDLTKVYSQVRGEVKVSIESQWKELEKVITQPQIVRIYSLVEIDKVYELNDLISQDYFSKLNDYLSNGRDIQRYLITNWNHLRVEFTDNQAASNKGIVFNLAEDLPEQLRKLEVILEELRARGKSYTSIDLTGSKIVVS